MSTAVADSYPSALDDYRARWPSDGYHTTRDRFLETYEVLSRFHTGGRIVDVGGWPGDFSCTLAMLGLDVLLIDKDPYRSTAKTLDDTTGEYGLGSGITLAEKCRLYGVEAVGSDIEHEPIPLADGSVDFLVFTEVIEHIRVGLLHALRELHRVLRPGGRLLLTTPNLLSLRNRLSFCAGRTSYDTLQMPYESLAAEERIGHPGHFRVFSMPELFDLLGRTGFQVIYSDYRHLLSTEAKAQPRSLYGLRMRAVEYLPRWIKSTRNTLVLVVTRGE
jgi:SAM-dependent methyltransferase